MKKNTILTLFFVIAVFCVGFFILLPVFRPGFLVTDDGDWMVIRLSAFYQSLREGQFPVRFLGRLNQSYGYPVANFLYPGFLYVGSVIHFFGVPFQFTVEAIIAVSVIIGGIGMFFWLKRRFNSYASSIGAFYFLLSPYLLYDIYKRGSVGELFAIAAAIVCFVSIEWKNKFLLPIATLFLAIGHNTMALFFIPVLCCYLVIRKERTLLILFFLGIGMSSFFWLPAIFEQYLVNFSRVDVSNPSHFFGTSVNIVIQQIPLYIAAILALFVKEKELHKERLLFGSILCCACVLSTPMSSYIWNIPAFSQFIQFPYRFQALTIVIGSWCIAYVVEKQKNVGGLAIIGIISFLLFALPYTKAENIIRSEGFFTTNEATTTVSDEYMPRWVTKQFEMRPAKRIEFYTGSGNIIEKKVTTQTIDIVVDAREPSVIQINSLFYPGWGGTLDNQPIKMMFDNPYGVMRIVIPMGVHHVYIAFRETVFRFIADSISFVSFVLCVYVIFLRKKKRI